MVQVSNGGGEGKRMQNPPPPPHQKDRAFEAHIIDLQYCILCFLVLSKGLTRIIWWKPDKFVFE